MNHEGGTPATAILAGLQKLATYRESDPESYKNLVAAIRGYSPAPHIYVAIRCTNTYAWLTQDSVSLVVNGAGSVTETFDINTDKVKQFRIPFLELIDPASFNSGATLSFKLDVEGHELTESMAFPFNTLLTKTAMSGSEGRYMITSYLGNPK